MPAAQNLHKAAMTTSAFWDLKPASLIHRPSPLPPPTSSHCKEDSTQEKKNFVGIQKKRIEHAVGVKDGSVMKSNLRDQRMMSIFAIVITSV